MEDQKRPIWFKKYTELLHFFFENHYLYYEDDEDYEVEESLTRMKRLFIENIDLRHQCYYGPIVNKVAAGFGVSCYSYQGFETI